MERRERFDASGPIPLAVWDRVVAGTISDAEFDCWLPAFERITARVEASESSESMRGNAPSKHSLQKVVGRRLQEN